MAKFNPVGWFEIPATDIMRAKKFYETSLRMELTLHEMGPAKMAWFPMVPDAIGAAGSLVQAAEYVPSREGTLVYFSCADIDGTLRRIEENGGKTLEAKRSIGEYGFIATFEDCEGNRLALHSRV